MLIAETETKTLVFDNPVEWRKVRESYEHLDWEIKVYGSDERGWYLQVERYL